MLIFRTQLATVLQWSKLRKIYLLNLVVNIPKTILDNRIQQLLMAVSSVARCIVTMAAEV